MRCISLKRTPLQARLLQFCSTFLLPSSYAQAPDGANLHDHPQQPSIAYLAMGAALMAIVCFVLLLVVKMLARHQQDQEAHDQQQEIQQDAVATADHVLLTAREFEGAKLVIFPGEDQPRVLAMPCSIREDEGLTLNSNDLKSSDTVVIM